MGAGGSEGGAGRFFLGFIMMCAGFYMLLNAITITSGFHLGLGIYRFSMMGAGITVTSGMILIPLILGVGMIFYNSRNIFGWLLSLGAMAALLFGVISSLRMGFRPMSAFDLITILVLAFGGLGLFLSSLRGTDAASLKDK